MGATKGRKARIEVTPDMALAGAAIVASVDVLNWSDQELAIAAEDIYRAMETVRRRSLPDVAYTGP